MGEAVTVLSIDDDVEVTEMISVMLGLEGFEVATAHSVFEGMKALADTLPDVVLLDVMMPRVDGMQFCAALRDSNETAQIPVIFVSALGGQKDLEAAKAAGAVGYVTKPLSSATLVTAINAALSAEPRV
ncbi:MAG: response regulator [Coriobacteriia bacterium]|nr:response regulator [Coriobacteriia bacterium]